MSKESLITSKNTEILHEHALLDSDLCLLDFENF
jgi:hypothetical protein